MATSNDTPDNSQPFPCLYEEVIEASEMAVIVFGMADLRNYARKTASASGDAILQLPMSATDIRDYYTSHKEKAKKFMKKKDFESLGRILAGGENGELQPHIEGGTLCHVGDENASHECVYCITTNSSRKCIVVSFRGSITVKDWIQDSKLVMADVENPLRDQQDQPEMVRIHYGFREYLYNNAPLVIASSAKKTGSIAKNTKDKVVRRGASKDEQEDEQKVADILKEPSQCKIDEILTKVQALVDELPDDYKVYIVGHSLGGALALVLAMEAAAKLKMKKPVTCVTLGNPRTENLNFRHVIQTLEEQGKLRCLCIHNHNDLVPKLPDVVSTCCYICVCRRHQTFRHVGLKMKLSEHDFGIVYHRRTEESMANDIGRQIKDFFQLLVSIPFVNEFIKSKAFSERHNYEQYLARLHAIHLDDFYEEARNAQQ